ncbi:hypothetical protein [Fodinicola feengrottensis]|uniref:hypothetical protein n=1 Tax=Fodinicola feengrottensis TaxID=435914 RepID=UPI0013D85C5E|nr:hypothetical protein [Fodinicola feengrottensis]
MTGDGGQRWRGYRIPLEAQHDLRMTVLTAAVVRVGEQGGGTEVITHDSGRTWNSPRLDTGPSIDRLPAGWFAGPGSAGVTMLDPKTGVEHVFDARHQTVQQDGLYQALVATDGSLWGFGPFGAKPAGNPTTAWVSRDRGQSWRDFVPRPDVPQRGGGLTTIDRRHGRLPGGGRDR